MVSKDLYLDGEEMKIKDVKKMDKTFDLLSLEKCLSVENSSNDNKKRDHNFYQKNYKDNDAKKSDLKSIDDVQIDLNPSPSHPLLTLSEGFNFNTLNKPVHTGMYNNFVLNENPLLIPKTSSNFFNHRKLNSISFNNAIQLNNYPHHSIISVNSNRKLLRAKEEKDGSPDFKNNCNRNPIENKREENSLYNSKITANSLNFYKNTKNKDLINYQNIFETGVEIKEMKNLNFNQIDLNSFLFCSMPTSYTLECNLVVNKKEKKSYLFMNHNDLLMMTGDKFRTKSQNVYLQDKDNIIANLKSNFLGTEFTLTDKINTNLCSINFEFNFFGLNKPRKVDLFIPKLDDDSGQFVKAKDEFVKQNLIRKGKN
jgi:hypothetical protein